MVKFGPPVLAALQIWLNRYRYSPGAKIILNKPEMIKVQMPAPGIEPDQMDIVINKDNQLVATFSNGIPPQGILTKLVKLMRGAGVDDEDPSRLYRYKKQLKKSANFEKAEYSAVKDRNSEVILTITDFERKDVVIKVKNEGEEKVEAENVEEAGNVEEEADNVEEADKEE